MKIQEDYKYINYYERHLHDPRKRDWVEGADMKSWKSRWIFFEIRDVRA